MGAHGGLYGVDCGGALFFGAVGAEGGVERGVAVDEVGGYGFRARDRLVLLRVHGLLYHAITIWSWVAGKQIASKPASDSALRLETEDAFAPGSCL